MLLREETRIAHVVAEIHEAGAKTVCLDILYKKADGSTAHRIVEPYELKQRNGKMFLYAFDLARNAIRAFEIGGVLEATATHTTFIPRWGIKIAAEEKHE